jgi:hypothetical protein
LPSCWITLSVNLEPDRDMITYNSCASFVIGHASHCHDDVCMGPAGIALHVSVQSLLHINYGWATSLVVAGI